ncbi:hypothetical protein KBJ98_04500 [Flavobacterium sp. F-328]|uniref:NUMOD4 motif-containing protein n=1 Tax=Flavobacterium erciyesense TaxID=2825842 RepID=A0ABS5D1Q7_9FLAO|nr:hypothetical protein [Flavobacterium erciyesense]MBQ0907957.1 hypothetical protein [Flavobacterium erciyesense]
MIRLYPMEEFREIEIDYPLRKRYAVSNRGRLMSFTETFSDGQILNGGMSSGYNTLRYKTNKNGKIVEKGILLYRVIAELFIPKPSEEHTHVIHLDFSRDNDHVNNLRWATPEEMMAHRNKNPKVQGIVDKVRETKQKSDGRKLTITQVIRLKKILNDPSRKTRAKILAKQFGISEMQVSRIKSGENWGHIKV